SGKSAFINLVKRGKCNQKCISFLMERGGAVDAKVKGKTALWYAVSHCKYCQRDACAHLLMQKGAKAEYALYGSKRTICETCYNLLSVSRKKKEPANIAFRRMPTSTQRRKKPTQRRDECAVAGKMYANGATWEKNCCAYVCYQGRLQQMDSHECLKDNKRCPCCHNQ
ncbi:unnamed protein product, partial [Meganyctiphanes norvegica]